MRTLTRVVLCCLLATATLYPQRGMGRGGFGGGFHGGFGGFHGGFGGFHGGGSFHGGFHGNGIVGRRGFGFGGFWGWPAWGWGWPAAYWPPYYGYGYGGYPAYYNSPAPNITVVYPAQPAAVPAYAYSAPAVVQQYDDYSPEVVPSRENRSSSPTYLIALKNHVIYAAISYSIKGDTLYFTTLQREGKSTPLMMVDRDLSSRLNRERNVTFQLP